MREANLILRELKWLLDNGAPFNQSVDCARRLVEAADVLTDISGNSREFWKQVPKNLRPIC